MKILVARIAWMKTYKNKKEEAYGGQKYIRNREGCPLESLNFKKLDGRYYGYVPHRGKDNFNLDIDKLGADRRDDKVENILVVFCARSREAQEQRVVGWYKNATVYRGAQKSKWDDDDLPVFRFSSENAFLVKDSQREFPIPKGFMGQSSVWYGINSDDYKDFRKELLAYIKQENLTRKHDKPTPIQEQRQLKKSQKLERRGDFRRFIYAKGFTCEVCGWSIDIYERSVWGSSFEIHHLNPVSNLEEGKSRELGIDDFAVLCASCHRAIHRTEHVSDVKAFKQAYSPREWG